MQHSEVRFEQKQECTGFDLFRYCHVLARRCNHRFPRQSLLPSGARIFYYTRRLLLAHGILPEAHPDAADLPLHVVERFHEAALVVAEWLVSEYPRAVVVRAALEPTSQRQLVPAPMVHPLRLLWESAHLCGSLRGAAHVEERIREISSGGANQEYVARLLALLRSDRLLVAPVARPDDTPHVALRLLRAKLEEDTERGWPLSLAWAYLYDEPLEVWLLRSLVAGRE